MSKRVNIEIEQGCTFSYDIELLNTDDSLFEVAGWTGYGSLRKHYLSNTHFDFNVTLADGVCSFSMDSTDTAVLEGGLYVYDVVIQDSADTVHRVISGMATVTPSVHR